jgi:hypothetical protein
VVTASPAVTCIVMFVVPPGVFMLPEGFPEATATPLTSIVAHESAAVGVTVTEATLTVDVYVVLPDENAGFRAPDESVRFDRSALVVSHGIDPPRLNMARELVFCCSKTSKSLLHWSNKDASITKIYLVSFADE